MACYIYIYYGTTSGIALLFVDIIQNNTIIHHSILLLFIRYTQYERDDGLGSHRYLRSAAIMCTYRTVTILHIQHTLLLRNNSSCICMCSCVRCDASHAVCISQCRYVRAQQTHSQPHRVRSIEQLIINLVNFKSQKCCFKYVASIVLARFPFKKLRKLCTLKKSHFLKIY